MPGVNFIEGINSNLNTTEIIEAIIGAERGHVNLMEEQQAQRTNQMTVYNSVSAMLLGLKAKMSALSNPASFQQTKIDVSDTSYASAASSGEVVSGSYRIAINQLAKNHQIASQGFSDEASDIGTGDFKISLGDNSVTTITLDSTNNTLEGLKDAINNSGAGISASIISDGTSSDPYRLLLTAKESGSSNQINVTSELTGGTAPDFSTSSFDVPETLNWSANSTSSVSLGATTAYDGSTNKTYTFTVRGTGTQTIGSGDIEIDWTDGTNSGTVTVSSASTEIALEGDGSNGLSLSFSAGDLVGGNTFQVQAFSPLVQAAQDAVVSVGSSDGGGSPIVVTSSTNTVDNVVPGVTLNLKKVTDSEVPEILISTDLDTSAIRSQIEDVISQYNEVMTRIDSYLEYNEETEEAGAMLGDTALLSINSRLSSLSTITVDGLDSGMRMLADIGIRTSSLGKLSVVDSGALQDALDNNLDDLLKLFTSWVDSDNPKVTYMSSTGATKASPDDGYEVNITQVATRGYLQGTAISDPSDAPITINDSNDTLKIKVNAMVSDEIVLEHKTYSSWNELVTEIQGKIDADEKIGDMGVEVSFSDTGNTGVLKLESASYGSGSKVEIQAGIANSAFITLGLAQAKSIAGEDVAGTINGEEAKGSGQILSGVSGNATTEGLKLKVELEAADLVEGADASIVFSKGIASQFDDLLDTLTKSTEGVIARRVSAIQSQIDYTTSRIEDEEDRLAIRKEALFAQYIEMESLIGDYNATGQWLDTQLAQLSANWSGGKSGS